jgi:signal transduction histidine kinase
VKEVLNNILKHANASEVYLRLRTDLEKFVLTIEDNGEGIRNEEHVHKVNGFRHASGQGHRNLEERMTTVGGSYQRTSELGHGTCVVLTVPFGVQKNADL